MIYLITGANGAGKTLYAVSLIDKLIADNDRPDALPADEWLAQFEEDDDGYLVPIVESPKPLIRNIFSNIPGLNFPSQYVFNLPKAGLYDWLDTEKYPYGSVFFDDECHRRIPGTGKSGQHGDPLVDKLDMHRHSGHDFYFITQYPSKLHHVVRGLVSSHYHLQNAMGAGAATLFTFPYSELNPNDYGARKSADKTVFRYPKKLYSYYKSSSLHTKRFRLPTSIKIIGVIMGAFLLLFLYLFFYTGSDSSVLSAAESIPAAPAPVRAEATAAAPVRVSVLSGCIAAGYNCQCYDSDYFPVEMDFSACMNQIEAPLPVRPVISDSRQ